MRASRSAGTCAPARPNISVSSAGSRTGRGAHPHRLRRARLAYVAAGRRDGYVEHHINAWDCLAAILLVGEAGGYVSDFLSGDGLTKGAPLVACAPGLKDAFVAAAAIRGSRHEGGRARARRGEGADRARRRRGAILERRGVRTSVAGDPAIWAEISPILYPVVGWTRDGARVGGRHYPLGLHGFARFETFAVEARAGTSSASPCATTTAPARSIPSLSGSRSNIA